MFFTITAIGMVALILSFPVAAIGLIWLSVTLFRGKSARPPLGAVVLGFSLSWLGWLLLFIGAMGTLGGLGFPFAGLGNTFSPGSAADINNTTAEPTADTLQGLVSVKLDRKTFLPSNAMAGNFQDQIQFHFILENTTNEDIRAFTGKVRFADVFGRRQKSIKFTHDETLAQGVPISTSQYTIDYNQFIDSDNWLRTTDIKDMQITFEPESVIFADGTQIGDAR